MRSRVLGALWLCALACGAAAQDAADLVDDKFAAAVSADPEGKVYFFEPFRADWKKNWVNSADAGFDGEWEWASDYSEVKGDYGMKMQSAGKRHAMASALKDVIEVKDSTLVVQYEVKAGGGFACDGAYLKLLQKEAVADLSKFDNTARYTIMFGPDRCGTNDKVHFILQHQNPVSKEWEEKHATDVPLSSLGDRMTHLFTLIVRPDNSFEILIDGESKKKGSLLKDMDPPVNPSKEIDDPDDTKPSDWVDVAKIEDPAAKKPDDWDESLPEYIPDDKASKPSGWEDDEPLQVPDPSAVKPQDWDDEEDGDWEAPIIDNPKCKVGCGEWKRPSIRNPDYKGKWYPPLIDNPDYKGPWAPRKIENKNFFVDEHPHNMHPISAVGFELLTTSGGIVFDNILITDSEAAAKAFADKTWGVRYGAEKKSDGGDGVMGTATKMLQNVKELMGELAEEKPMVLAAIIGTSVVVFVAFVYLLCCSGGDPVPASTKAGSKPPPGSAADKKKSDEPTQDDAAEDEDSAAAGAAGSDDGEIQPAAASGSAKKRASRKD